MQYFSLSSLVPSTTASALQHEHEHQHQHQHLPPNVWELVFSFLTPTDLCQTALANREFHAWSIEDRLWKPHCFELWIGKQAGLFKESILSSPSSSPSSVAPSAAPSAAHSWKQKFAWTVFDSRRQVISREELIHYDWKLMYNGQESKLGLRKFSPDGIYRSPYAGPCEWALQNCHLHVMQMALPIQRDFQSWGWIIGQGHVSVYFSVDPVVVE